MCPFDHTAEAIIFDEASEGALSATLYIPALHITPSRALHAVCLCLCAGIGCLSTNIEILFIVLTTTAISEMFSQYFT